MSGAFLSSSWYHVASFKPRLRTHVQVHRHRYRGEAAYVLQDHVQGRSHRLSAAEYAFVGRMDGAHSVDAIWRAVVGQLREDAPSQHETIELLAQLHGQDLIQGDALPDVIEQFDRHARQARSKIWRTLLNPMSVRLPLLDPDRFLGATLPLLRPLLGWCGALVWLAVVGVAGVLAVQHWAELTDNLGDRLLATESLIAMALCYPIIKILHELGHGYAVKAGGGEVHELGVMFLVFLPVPYLDASASWGFRRKRQRMLVGAAGILVEVFIAALALFVWLGVEPGLARAIAWNVMVVAGLSTVLFNGNPLLRFDGYFVLADLIEIPNLAQRGNLYWKHLVERFAFAVKPVEAFRATPGENAWFLAYAPASYAYRLSILFSIALFVASEYLVVGALLAAWSVITGILVPVGKALGHVLFSPRLAERRGRAVGLTTAAIAAIAAPLLLVPAPLHTNAEGIVWLPDASHLRAGTDGFVTRLRVAPGGAVAAGDVVIEAEEPVLAAQVETLQGRIAELEAKLGTEQFADRAQAEITRMELDLARKDHAEKALRAERLIVRSAADGVFRIASAVDLPGRFMREGSLVGYVTPESSRVVRVAVVQDDVALVRRRLAAIRVKLAGHLDKSYEARLVREVPAARDELPARALGTAGGGNVLTDPRDPQGLKTLQRVFQFDLQLPAHAPTTRFATRVYVRFEHEAEPLGAQLYRRLRQLFLARLHA